MNLIQRLANTRLGKAITIITALSIFEGSGCSEKKVIHEFYDPNDRLIKLVAEGGGTIEHEYDYNGDGVSDERREYEYDPKGRIIIRLMVYTPNNLTRANEFWEYEYDSNGRKTKSIVQRYDSNNKEVMSGGDYDGDGVFDDECEYEYDPKGRIMRLRVYNPNNLTRRNEVWEYEYDSNGNPNLNIKDLNIKGMKNGK